MSRLGKVNNNLDFMYYVYILFSLKDRKLYTGMSGNLKQRYLQHKREEVDATKFRLPILLIHYEAYRLKSDARRREKYLKGGNGRADLKIQLQDDLARLKYKFL
jgi:putative endonuclease